MDRVLTFDEINFFDILMNVKKNLIFSRKTSYRKIFFFFLLNKIEYFQSVIFIYIFIL